MTGRIADGTLIGATALPVAVVIGGARINLRDNDEKAEIGHANDPVRRVPRRVFNGLTGRIADGTLVAAPDLPVALIAGGARVNLRDAGEITATGHGGQPVTRIPERVFTGLETDFADGTLLRSPAAAEIWRVAAGRRSRVNGGAAQLVPQRVLDGIPIA
jgi:hypothetical protein